MRAAVVIILLCRLLHAFSEAYLLPDAKHELSHRLGQQIDAARESVICITPALQNPRIRDALAAAARRDVPVTLLSSGSDDGAKLVQYRSVDYRILRGLASDTHEGALAMTLLLVDSDTGCFGSAPLSDTHLSQDVALFECTDDPDRLRGMRDIAERLYRRSAAYLGSASETP